MEGSLPHIPGEKRERDVQIPRNDEGTLRPPFLGLYRYLILDNSIRGFAYIEFEEAEDAEEAIFNMNESELYNRVIKVEVAKPHRGIGGLDSSLPGNPPQWNDEN